MNSDNISVCKLCQKNTELIRSHVVPESFYKNLYEGEKKTSIFTSKNRQKFTKLQKGYFDRILCKACDGETINYYDSFGYNFIMKELPKVIPSITRTLIANKNKDFYIKLKGFIYSVFWRAHYSSAKFGVHKEFKLDTEILDLIRKSIIDKNFTSEKLPKLYINIVYYPPNDHEIMRQIVSAFNLYSYRENNANGKFVAVLFGGLLFQMMLDDDYPSELNRYLIPNNMEWEIPQIPIYHLPMYDALQSSVNYYNQIQESGDTYN